MIQISGYIVTIFRLNLHFIRFADLNIPSHSIFKCFSFNALILAAPIKPKWLQLVNAQILNKKLCHYHNHGEFRILLTPHIERP